MAPTEADHRHCEQWSAQQVIPQRRSTDRSNERTEPRRTFARRCKHLFWEISVYHKLSAFVFFTNLIIVTAWCSKRRLPDDSQTCVQSLAANLLLAILIREEHVVNLLYYIFGSIPHSVPLRIRRHAANLYHLGGIHSGAALAASLWLVMLNIAVGRSAANGIHQDGLAVPNLCLAGFLDLLVLQMILLSLPKFRHKWHNIWEGTHRCSGWVLLLVFWCYLAASVSLLSQRKDGSNISAGERFYTNPVSYFLIAMTFCNLSPWLYLKKVEPRYHKLSDHATQLDFDHWPVNPCRTPKLSTSPWLEWHAFAAIPWQGRDGCSVIISNAGDWTSRMINNPPKSLWIRGYPAQGVLYMAKIFKSVLCVTTGAGIAPVLGLLDIPGTKFRIMWSVSAPETTYSKEIVQRVLRADRDAVILDTAIRGRANLVEEAARIYRTGNIEAVFVVSNVTATEEIVKGLRQRGVLTYSPIFDS